MKDTSNFALRLKEALKTKKITAKELSKRTGIATSSISEYINGKFTPKTDKMMALAEALDISPLWLTNTLENDIDLNNTPFYSKMLDSALKIMFVSDDSVLEFYKGLITKDDLINLRKHYLLLAPSKINLINGSTINLFENHIDDIENYFKSKGNYESSIINIILSDCDINMEDFNNESAFIDKVVLSLINDRELAKVENEFLEKLYAILNDIYFDRNKLLKIQNEILDYTKFLVSKYTNKE